MVERYHIPRNVTVEHHIIYIPQYGYMPYNEWLNITYLTMVEHYLYLTMECNQKEGWNKDSKRYQLD